MLLELNVGSEVGGRVGRLKVESKFGEGSVLDEELEFSLEVEGLETSISEESEGEVLGDGDVDAAKEEREEESISLRKRKGSEEEREKTHLS